MDREVGGGIGMGNTCKPMAVSFQCMTKFTTNKKKIKIKKKKNLLQHNSSKASKKKKRKKFSFIEDIFRDSDFSKDLFNDFLKE